jgi:hypothetical protein
MLYAGRNARLRMLVPLEVVEILKRARACGGFALHAVSKIPVFA